MSCAHVRTVVAERRKQAIVESKFLGGDIQHTHLVKGLDFVLLDKVYKFTFLCKYIIFNAPKVRSEIHVKVKETEDQGVTEKKEKERAKAEVADDLKFNSTMGMRQLLEGQHK